MDTLISGTAVRVDPDPQTRKRKIHGKRELIVNSLQKFYATCEDKEEVMKLLEGTSDISLRLIDWFVTNYSKKFNVAYTHEDRQFMVHFHYKRELKAYSKRLFDPFCRRERISFQIRGQAPIEETTVGQLNFFRWAIEKGVIRYILEHVADIERDMNVSFREHYSKDTGVKTATGRRKRKEMSHSAMKAVNHHDAPITVSFD